MIAIENLWEELEIAKEENAQLKEDAGFVKNLPHPSKLKSYGISPSGFRLLNLLSKRKMVSRDTAFRSLWPDDNEPDNALTTVHVQLSRLRKKLNLEIPNVWHQGWYLSDADRVEVASIMTEIMK